jgi:hypothetical protein
MNPFVLRDGETYHLFYAGADADGHRRICRATAPVADITQWTRHGVVLDLGAPGTFCANWCVVPLVHKFGDRWHLYFSGNSGGPGGLQAFPGIGLAVSDDGLHFTHYRDTPIITGDQTADFPNNRGIAGGGTILEDRQADGTLRYRMYYTLAVGTPSTDMRVDQEKHCAVCHSTDGITWTDHRLIMSPRADVSFEDAAVAAPFVWRDDTGYRMLYSAIGTRWGFYSIGEARSDDGYTWTREPGDAALSLAPRADVPGAWDQQMVAYACVVPEEGGMRLFYCGNGYGTTGIGTALSVTL